MYGVYVRETYVLLRKKDYSEDIAEVPLQGARSFPLVLPACSSLTVYRRRLSIYLPHIPCKRRYNKGDLGSGGFCEV